MGDDSNDVSVYAGHISSLLTRLGWSVSLVRLLATVRWLANLSSATTSLITILCFFLVAFSRLFCFFLLFLSFLFLVFARSLRSCPFYCPFSACDSLWAFKSTTNPKGNLVYVCSLVYAGTNPDCGGNTRVHTRVFTRVSRAHSPLHTVA